MNWLSLRRLVARSLFLQLALSMSLLSAAHAQNSPTAEQLQIFQGLSLEQQQAVLEQAGGQGNTRDAVPTDRRVQNGNAIEPESGQRVSVEPVDAISPNALTANDIVVLELALPGTMPKGSVQSGNSVNPGAETAPRRLRAKPEQPLDARELERLTDIIELVRARNPYQLDRSGQLILPGFAPIRLAGLSESQAVQLLSAEPELLQLDVSLSRLPIAKTGVEGLKPFGYDFFDNVRSGRSQGSELAVPADYIVGAGDELNVQLFGSQNRTLRLVVSREGTVNFPELGPIRVAGQTFSAAKANIESRVTQQMIGVRANVVVSDMRSIGVLVLGEVRQRGNHTVDGLATVTSALYSSGGITSIGSLRDIQLIRRGVVVRRLDLYDLLMRGSTVDDARLLPGDVVFVPTVGPTVSIEGEVKRPAIYELRGEESAANLLQMAGGLTTEADPSRSNLTRVDEQSRRVVLDVDFNLSGSRSQLLRNGDALRVSRLRPQLDSGVKLDGFVHRPGNLAWRQGLRLSDVLGSIDELKPNADARYVLIRRESGADRKVEAFSADLVAALAQRGGAADTILAPRDQIIVFDLAPGRERIIKPLLDELRLQSGLSRPPEVVQVDGRVKVPGEYPLEPGMTVSDLLRAGGNLDAAAFGGNAELARQYVDGEGVRQTELIDIDLAAVLRGDANADLALRPFDHLLIKETPEWSDQGSVTFSGEVRYPGSYPMRRGETLYEAIERAGGLTTRAFAKGSAFTRVSLREREQKTMDHLADRMQIDIATMSLQAAAANQTGASQAMAAGQSLLADLKSSRAVGRLVIDLQGLMVAGKGSEKDVLLRDGDLLHVPPQAQEVTVIGEVQTATSHLYSSALRRDDYIALSGGTNRKADKGKIYVVRADGSVVASTGGMLRRGYSISILPGDTIVVPLDTERMPRLPFWQAVTQIIYNLAVSVAAVNSF